MNVILIIGSKGSGKDYAAGLIKWGIAAKVGSKVVLDKFALPLQRAIPTLFGISGEEWEVMYNQHKEIPHKSLHNLSPREAVVWMAEEVVKPKFGSNFFGEVVSNKLENYYSRGVDLVVYSDFGFLSEWESLDKCEVIDNVFVLELNSEDGVHTGERKSGFTAEELGIKDSRYAKVFNNKDESFKGDIMNVLEGWGLL